MDQIRYMVKSHFLVFLERNRSWYVNKLHYAGSKNYISHTLLTFGVELGTKRDICGFRPTRNGSKYVIESNLYFLVFLERNQPSHITKNYHVGSKKYKTWVSLPFAVELGNKQSIWDIPILALRTLYSRIIVQVGTSLLFNNRTYLNNHTGSQNRLQGGQKNVFWSNCFSIRSGLSRGLFWYIICLSSSSYMVRITFAHFFAHPQRRQHHHHSKSLVPRLKICYPP